MLRGAFSLRGKLGTVTNYPISGHRYGLAQKLGNWLLSPVSQIMARGNVTLRIPNPHQGDIGTGLLLRVLKQAGIARAEWERL